MSTQDPRHSSVLADDVALARTKISRAAKGPVWSWRCPHCGGPRAYGQNPDGGWWTADLLREAAGVSGPAAMLAMNALVNEGLMEMDSRLRVRWRR